MYKPNNIQIHTITKCSLNCHFCIKGKTDIPEFNLHMDTFRNYVDRCVEFGIRNFELTPCVGDPLCDPYILDRVDYLSGKDIDSVYFYTNLHLMDDYKLQILSSFDKFRLYVSVYDTDDEGFYFNIRNLIDNYSSIIEEFHMRVDNWDIRRLDKISEPLCRILKTGVLMGNIKTCQIIKKSKNFDWYGNLVVDEIEFSEPIRNGRRGPCHFAKVDNGIFPDGDITLCHWFDIHKRMIIGNVGDLQKTYRDDSLYQKVLGEQEQGLFRSMCINCQGYQGVCDDDPVL